MIEALVPLDPLFDLARNILDGIQRTFLAEQEPAKAVAILSPLTPLPPSESPSRIPSDLDEVAKPKNASGFPPSPTPGLSEAEQTALPLTSLLSSERSPSSSLSAFMPSTDGAENSRPAKRAKSAKKKARDKRASHRNRKGKKYDQGGYVPNEKLAQKQIGNARPVLTSYESQNLKIASTGFVGLRGKKKSKAYFLEELIGPKAKFNLKLKTWTGGEQMPILDCDKRIVGVCAGIPKDAEDWVAVHLRAANLLEGARSKLIFDKERDHRRGKFPAINVGISHGGGQPHPKILRQNEKNVSILEDLMKDEAFERISGFATGAFATWAPRLYRYQNDCLTSIIDKDKELRSKGEHPNPDEEELCRNWSRTPWAAAALNFGPQTICYPHADFGNLAFGWCSITALGNYDYKKGGHLILWDLGLVIELPPGATILIPSSAIEHSNVRISTGETRYSVTQYSPGGLFRWISNGFQTVEKRRATMAPGEIASSLEELSHQLEFGLSLFSTVQELEYLRHISIKAL